MSARAARIPNCCSDTMDLTKEVALTTSWTEITAPLGMTDGESYLIDFDGAQTRAKVYSAETDDANSPGATVSGHAIVPASWNRSVDSRIYTKRAGVRIWVRVSLGDAKVVATATGG